MKTTLVSLAAICAAFTASAAAEDFTFTVPVNVNNLPPEIDSLKVACTVHDGSRTGIGGKSVTVAVSDGAYNGDVVVAFDELRDNTRHRAQTYICRITEFIDSGSRVWYTNFSSDPSRFFPLADGAPFVYTTGDLPLP